VRFIVSVDYDFYYSFYFDRFLEMRSVKFKVGFKMKKKSMPHIKTKDSKYIDLYLENMLQSERQKFYDDLKSSERPVIKLPNFGKVQIGKFDLNIYNDKKNEITIDDLDEDALDYIKRVVDSKQIPHRPFIIYNSQKHKFELKKDSEHIISEVIKSS